MAGSVCKMSVPSATFTIVLSALTSKW